jgi:UDP-glucose 4-epimerase
MSRIIVFGGTGSLGRKLIERFLPNNDVAVYSRDEAKHWSISNDVKVGNLAHRMSSLQFYVGDVRDKQRIRDVIRQFKPEIVIIAAALKQVDTCELSPYESVQTNLLGTQNIIDVVNEHVENNYDRRSLIEKVLFVSTDKACQPVNVYGMCKAISERLVTSQAMTGHTTVKYLATRYGNVLESRGSIIPLFKYQCMHGTQLTVTDLDMTRFLMTLDDSVDLIERTLHEGKSGETWIPRLPAMRIGCLANIFSKLYNIPIKIIGARPGEKRDEDLISLSESTRTRLTEDQHNYVIAPAFMMGKNDSFVYSSNQSVMNEDELFKHLNELGIIEAPLETFKGIVIEEIATNRKE